MCEKEPGFRLMCIYLELEGFLYMSKSLEPEAFVYL